MFNHTIVCDFEKEIIDKFTNTSFVIKTNDEKELCGIYKYIRKKNVLWQIVLELDDSLSSLKFKNWLDIPVCIYANSIGDKLKILNNIEKIRRNNLIFFLPSDNDDSYNDLHFLSSIGINCGMIFKQNVNWNLLLDLLYYYLYSQTKHTIIEPFEYIIQNYSKKSFNRYTDFNEVYFNTPAKFLHINKDLKIATTINNMNNSIYTDLTISSLSGTSYNFDLLKQNKNLYNLFLKKDNCVYCPGFRICLGKFSIDINSEINCKSIFVEIINYINKEI